MCRAGIRGIRCWIAPRDVFPGEEYAASLVRALHESRVMVLVFSSGANRSPQVLREVERAVSRGVPILPLRIEDVPPSEAMEYYISSRHWLDALNPPLEQHLVRLADTVKFLLSNPGNDAPPHRPEPAIQPVGTVQNVSPQVVPIPKSTPPFAPENFQQTPNASSIPAKKLPSTTVILISLIAVLTVAIVIIAVIHFHSSSVSTATTVTQPSAAPSPIHAEPSATSSAVPASGSTEVTPAPVSSPMPSSPAYAPNPAQEFLQGLNDYQGGRYPQALTLFRESAAQGNALAQNYLGLMYMNGHGVPTDYAQALSWYNKAAAQGNFSGECNLGIMYERGLGVPKDKVTAYMWYTLATQSGSPLAPKNAKLLAPQMTPQQLNEAQRRAAALKARQK